MTTDLARASTLEAIKALAVGLDEASREANAARLLERIAAAGPHASERMRAALVELGALAVLDEGLSP